MNKLIITLSLLISSTALADLPGFSAFVSGDTLYTTIMVDTCNSHSASLSIAPNCSRAGDGMFSTTDYVTTCSADLQIVSTKMACSEMTLKPQAFEINLKDYKLRDTIDTLELSVYENTTINVDLNEDSQLGAFVVNNELKLTIFGDSCNSIGANLEVENLCRKDRLTKNRVVSCSAKLLVFQTEMACGDMSPVARVTSINLENSQVAPEAISLQLDYYNSITEVDLK